MLQSALAMSVDPSPAPGFTPDNFDAMTEEQQIAFALQMSLADSGSSAMETDSTPIAAATSLADTAAATSGSIERLPVGGDSHVFLNCACMYT